MSWRALILLRVSRPLRDAWIVYTAEHINLRFSFLIGIDLMASLNTLSTICSRYSIALGQSRIPRGANLSVGCTPNRWRSSRRDPARPRVPLFFAYICCPRDCVSRHNGGTSGAPLKPLRVDSALFDGKKCNNKVITNTNMYVTTYAP